METENHLFLKADTANLVHRLENQIKELTEANERLQNLERQRAQFFNVISHELRTPFTPIRGYIDLLRKGALGSLTPPQQQALAVISESLNNALRLLDDLLDLSKLNATGLTLSPELFPIKELLAEVVKTGKTYVENSTVAFETDIPDDLPLIFGDKDRLRQVILKLLNMAVKFTPEGEITLSARVNEDKLVIRVKDTGLGLLPAEIPQVFDEFWQNPDMHDIGLGTGLGLAISKSLIEAHQGEIWIESEKGSGTTVSFSIPVTEARGHAKKQMLAGQ